MTCHFKVWKKQKKTQKRKKTNRLIKKEKTIKYNHGYLLKLLFECMFIGLLLKKKNIFFNALLHNLLKKKKRNTFHHSLNYRIMIWASRDHTGQGYFPFHITHERINLQTIMKQNSWLARPICFGVTFVVIHLISGNLKENVIAFVLNHKCQLVI